MSFSNQSIGNYEAKANRYDTMQYRRCGKSGILLPVISVGLWHNFGHADDFTNMRAILRCAFDNGVSHFDLANNYGPPYGAAEENFGRIFDKDFRGYRDELFLSSKAGWDMWPGPYGNFGSRKYLMASLDQSLKRMGVGLCRCFLPPPTRPRYTFGRNHGCIALDSTARQSTLCRRFPISSRINGESSSYLKRNGH